MSEQDPTKKSSSPQTEEVGGLRMTRQRQEVYRILLEERTHPTANEVYMKVKERLPNISLATVYNCLEVLVDHGIIRQVHFERESSRYCPNLTDHGHFHDSETGVIHDVHFQAGADIGSLLKLPEGAQVEEIEITIRGRIAK